MGVLGAFRETMTGRSAPQAPEDVAKLLDGCVIEACAELGLREADIYCGGQIVTMFLTPDHAWEAVIVGPDAYQLYPGFISSDGGSISWPNVWVADNYSLAKFVDALEDAFKEAAAAA